MFDWSHNPKSLFDLLRYGAQGKKPMTDTPNTPDFMFPPEQVSYSPSPEMHHPPAPESLRSARWQLKTAVRDALEKMDLPALLEFVKEIQSVAYTGFCVVTNDYGFRCVWSPEDEADVPQVETLHEALVDACMRHMCLMSTNPD